MGNSSKVLRTAEAYQAVVSYHILAGSVGIVTLRPFHVYYGLKQISNYAGAVENWDS